MRAHVKLQGFTLIELLVSLAVFSIIIVTVYSTFSSGIESWRRIESRLETVYSARIILDRIAYELRNAVPCAGMEFDGENDMIAFISSLAIKGAKNSELTKIVYAVKQGNAVKGNVLVKKTAGRREGFSELDVKENELLYNVIELSFKYPFQIAEGFSEIEWKDHWNKNEDGQMPKGVRIMLAIADPRNPYFRKEFKRTVYIPSGILGKE